MVWEGRYGSEKVGVGVGVKKVGGGMERTVLGVEKMGVGVGRWVEAFRWV